VVLNVLNLVLEPYFRPHMTTQPRSEVLSHYDTNNANQFLVMLLIALLLNQIARPMKIIITISNMAIVNMHLLSKSIITVRPPTIDSPMVILNERRARKPRSRSPNVLGTTRTGTPERPRPRSILSRVKQVVASGAGGFLSPTPTFTFSK